MTPRCFAPGVLLIAQLATRPAWGEPRVVPVTFKSVTDVPFDMRVTARAALLPQICDTPCTLHLEPGLYRMEAHAPGRLDLYGGLRVDGRPMAVDVNAITEARFVSGGTLVIGGSAVATVGVFWLLFQEVLFEPMLNVDGPARDLPERKPLLTIGIGGGIAVLGAVLIATADHGFRVRRSHAP